MTDPELMYRTGKAAARLSTLANLMMQGDQAATEELKRVLAAIEAVPPREESRKP